MLKALSASCTFSLTCPTTLLLANIPRMTIGIFESRAVLRRMIVSSKCTFRQHPSSTCFCSRHFFVSQGGGGSTLSLLMLHLGGFLCGFLCVQIFIPSPFLFFPLGRAASGKARNGRYGVSWMDNRRETTTKRHSMRRRRFRFRVGKALLPRLVEPASYVLTPLGLSSYGLVAANPNAFVLLL